MGNNQDKQRLVVTALGIVYLLLFVPGSFVRAEAGEVELLNPVIKIFAGIFALHPAQDFISKHTNIELKGFNRFLLPLGIIFLAGFFR